MEFHFKSSESYQKERFIQNANFATKVNKLDSSRKLKCTRVSAMEKIRIVMNFVIMLDMLGFNSISTSSHRICFFFISSPISFLFISTQPPHQPYSVLNFKNTKTNSTTDHLPPQPTPTANFLQFRLIHQLPPLTNTLSNHPHSL